MTKKRQMLILRIAAVLALIGLGFMCWAALVPTPMPVILSMSVGQGLGTLSFLLYLFVVIMDLRRHHVLDPRPEESIPPPMGEPAPAGESPAAALARRVDERLRIEGAATDGEATGGTAGPAVAAPAPPPPEEKAT